MTTSKVKVVDKGWNATMHKLSSVSGMYVKVGVLEGTKRDDGISLAGIAAVHEFGSRKCKIPQRSFIRSWLKEKKSEISAKIKEVYLAIVDKQADPEKAMKQLGAFAKDGIKEKLLTGDFVPLAPATIRRRKHGGTKPLIDTGQLLSGIRSKVVKK